MSLETNVDLTVLMFLILGAVVVAIAIIVLIGIIQAPRIAAEREAELNNAFQNPDAAAVGMKLPAALLAMYDADCSSIRNFDVLPPRGFRDPLDAWHVERFLPLHPISLKGFDNTEELPNCFPFAEDKGGDYYVDCTSDSEDPPVRYCNADAACDLEVAPSLTAFLSWERRFAERR